VFDSLCAPTRGSRCETGKVIQQSLSTLFALYFITCLCFGLCYNLGAVFYNFFEMRVSMFGKYAVKRILLGVLSYVTIIFVYSVLLNTSLEATIRGQIWEMVQGYMMTEEVKELPEEEFSKARERMTQQLEKQYGLDRLFVVRVLDRTAQALRFDFGETSYQTADGSQKIGDVVWEAAQGTIILFGVSSIICVWIGVFLGKLKAQKNGSHFDKSTSLLTMVFFGTPSWWVGSIMIFIFVYSFRLFPAGNFHSVPVPQDFVPYVLDSMYHMFLPVFTLVMVGFWGTAYIVRNILMGKLHEDYIMSARARGIPERKVMNKHAMRSAAPPIVTMTLLSILTSINGSVPVERVFSWPGLGLLLWKGLKSNDVPLMMGVLCVTTLIYCAGLIFLDLIYGFLDPRINYSGD